MYTFYAFVTGPLAWIAFIVFIGGLLFQLVRLILQAYRGERFIFEHFSLRYGLRSIGHWLIPFGTVNWRRHPVVTVATFCFHISLIAAPLFLSAHYVLADDAFGVRWPVLPNIIADVMTLIVIAGCLFFLIRRMVRPEVRFVTRPTDYVFLVLVFLPFFSGMMAYHQLGNPVVATFIHMISGEVLLVVIPFSRLRHMLYAVFTRSYIGSEFGKVRHARDW